MKKKLIITILLAALVMQVAACSKSVRDSETQSTAAETTAAETVQTESGPVLGVPKSDYNGAEFTVLTTQYGEYEYNISEQSGDIVSDAVYTRNLAVEELLGIDISYSVVPGEDPWGGRTLMNNTIKNSVLAADGAFDLISAVTVATLPTAAEGYYLDASELEYVDFSNPWWVAGQEGELSINGKLYGFIGDASLSMYKDLSVIFFNRALCENYSIGDPYEMVRDGAWTIDKLIELTAKSSADLDGDGVMNAETDLYGLIGMAVPQRGYMTSTGINIIERDEAGTPYFTALPESAVTIYQKLWGLFKESENVYTSPTADHSVYSAYFANGRSLFMNTFLRCSDYLRDMEDDYGIIPYPMADEAQNGYYTQIGTSTSMTFVPITANDPTLTSMVCEAMAYFSSKEVTPAYYEVTLKEKYARSEDVKEMLDIIRGGASMSFVFAYSTCFAEYPNCITEFSLKDTKGESIASWYEKNLDKWNITLSSIVDSYGE